MKSLLKMLAATLSLALFFSVGILPSHANATNIALGSNVSLNGTFFTDSGWSGDKTSPANSIVSGVFQPETTQWNTAGIWWNGNANPNNSIIVNLNKSFSINSFILQADDNDNYTVSYLDSSNNWVPAYTAPTIPSWGLVTRPVFDLPTPIVTSEIKITGVYGDGLYSVSQIEINSSTVPEPGTMALLGLGMAGLAIYGKRRKNAKA